MAGKSKTGGRRSASAAVPDKQSCLDMLASWCQMATEAGLQVEQRYILNASRFVVRVEDVLLGDDDQLLVKGADDEGG